MSNLDKIRAFAATANARAEEVRSAQRKKALEVELAQKKANQRAIKAAKLAKRRKALRVSDYAKLEKKAANQTNINHYTDASKYTQEHYGARFQEQKSYESDWN